MGAWKAKGMVSCPAGGVPCPVLETGQVASAAQCTAGGRGSGRWAWVWKGLNHIEEGTIIAAEDFVPKEDFGLFPTL